MNRCPRKYAGSFRPAGRSAGGSPGGDGGAPGRAVGGARGGLALGALDCRDLEQHGERIYRTRFDTAMEKERGGNI